jgi:hypothetical protein
MEKKRWQILEDLVITLTHKECMVEACQDNLESVINASPGESLFLYLSEDVREVLLQHFEAKLTESYADVSDCLAQIAQAAKEEDEEKSGA